MTAYNLYTLKDIPFGKFQQYLIDADLSVLGDAPEEVLIKHGESLYLDFCDATATTETKSIILLDAGIQHYTLKIMRLDLIMEALSLGYNAEIAELLKDESDYPLTEETYREDIEKITTESIQYRILKSQYEKDRAQIGGGETKATYEYYADVLNAISDMVKYNVDENISTLRYCKYYVQLIKNIEQLNRKRNGGRSTQ